MNTFKKYSVSPVTEGWSSADNKNVLKTTSKAEADKRAKLLTSKGIKTNYNVDTFKDGKCIRNEFGYYENGKVRRYSTINYTTKKAKKKIVEPKVTEASMRMFFSDAEVEKWKQANKI